MCTNADPRRRRSQKFEGGPRSCDFSTDMQLHKFPTNEIMGAQNINFAAKFFQNSRFSTPNFVFLNDNFRTKKIVAG